AALSPAHSAAARSERHERRYAKGYIRVRGRYLFPLRFENAVSAALEPAARAHLHELYPALSHHGQKDLSSRGDQLARRRRHVRLVFERAVKADRTLHAFGKSEHIGGDRLVRLLSLPFAHLALRGARRPSRLELIHAYS